MRNTFPGPTHLLSSHTTQFHSFINAARPANVTVCGRGERLLPYKMVE